MNLNKTPLGKCVHAHPLLFAVFCLGTEVCCAWEGLLRTDWRSPPKKLRMLRPEMCWSHSQPAARVDQVLEVQGRVESSFTVHPVPSMPPASLPSGVRVEFLPTGTGSSRVIFGFLPCHWQPPNVETWINCRPQEDKPLSETAANHK